MTDERIIAYLLKELPEDELERFEEECFAQEDWPLEINSAEEDLIDAYLRNELNAEQRQRFEQNYLTTEGRCERVRMAAALLRHVDAHYTAVKLPAPQSQTKSRWADWFRALLGGQNLIFRAGTAVLVAALIIGLLWLFLFRKSAPQTFATLSLSLSVNNREEGGRAARVTLPIKEDALKIALRLPDASAADQYRVTLMNANGETKPLDVVEQDGQFISVVIPAGQLQRGQYALLVFMKKGDNTEQRISGSYLFTVE